MVYRGTPQRGEDPVYDRQQDRILAIRNARYANIAEAHAAEQNYAQQLKKRKELEQNFQTAEAAFLKAKYALSIARSELKALQTEMANRSKPDKIKAEKCKRIRQEAEAAGKKQYLTGYACKNGHIDYRYTSSGACVACDDMYSRPGYTKRSLKKAGGENDGLHRP